MFYKVKFHAAEDVQEFVNAASRCDFDIDICSSRIIIDAKSFLGILSMDLSKCLTVTCHGENRDFTRILQKYAAV